MKVFIVILLKYDDYEVIGCFSSLEMAKLNYNEQNNIIHEVEIDKVINDGYWGGMEDP